MSAALFLWFDWLTCCRDQNNGFTYDHLQVAFHIRLERKPACDRLELTIEQPSHLTTCSRHWHLNTTPKHTYMIHFSWRPISITWYKQIILNISITHLLGDFKRNQCRQYVYPFAHSSWAYQSKIDILKKKNHYRTNCQAKMKNTYWFQARSINFFFTHARYNILGASEPIRIFTDKHSHKADYCIPHCTTCEHLAEIVIICTRYYNLSSLQPAFMYIKDFQHWRFVSNFTTYDSR